jgi:Subtilase family
MSLGGVGFAGAVRDAIRTAVESGMIVMAAAGNHVGFVTAPASWPECLAIGGINIGDAPWSGSSHGREVDFCAPAEAVWAATARRDGDRPVFTVEPHDGTSFAVANTAGAAALWLAHHGADALRRRYGKGNLQRLFLSVARATVRTPAGWDAREYGAGILDARALLEAPLPDPAAFTRAPARAAGEAPAPTALDRLATLWPELTKRDVRSALGRRLGKRGQALDDLIERFGGELHYQYSQDAELRRSLVAPAGTRSAAGPAAPDLRRTSSYALRRALDAR